MRGSESSKAPSAVKDGGHRDCVCKNSERRQLNKPKVSCRLGNQGLWSPWEPREPRAVESQGAQPIKKGREDHSRCAKVGSASEVIPDPQGCSKQSSEDGKDVPQREGKSLP